MTDKFATERAQIMLEIETADLMADPEARREALRVAAIHANEVLAKVLADPDLPALPKKKPSIWCELWSINRWLRFTGVRIYVTWDADYAAPTMVGFTWWGWSTIRSEGW